MVLKEQDTQRSCLMGMQIRVHACVCAHARVSAVRGDEGGGDGTKQTMPFLLIVFV